MGAPRLEALRRQSQTPESVLVREEREMKTAVSRLWARPDPAIETSLMFPRDPREKFEG